MSYQFEPPRFIFDCNFCGKEIPIEESVYHTYFGTTCELCTSQCRSYLTWLKHLQNNFDKKVQEIRNNCIEFIKESND